MITWFFTITATLAVILQFFNHRFLGNGELHKVYPLSIVIYALYAVIETTLALTKPDQIGIMVFNIVNFWAIYNAIRGWKRLKR